MVEIPEYYYLQHKYCTLVVEEENKPKLFTSYQDASSFLDELHDKNDWQIMQFSFDTVRGDR